jgi:hypothetical protein
MDLPVLAAFSSRYRIIFNIPPSGIDLKCLIEKIMLRIAEDCAELKAKLIGHIKCIAETEDGNHISCSVLSSEGGAESRGEFRDGIRSVTITQNTLVYGLPASTLRAIWTRTLQKVIRPYGVYHEEE